MDNLYIDMQNENILLTVQLDKTFTLEDVNTGQRIDLDKKAVFSIIQKARQFLVDSQR